MIFVSIFLFWWRWRRWPVQFIPGINNLINSLIGEPILTPSSNLPLSHQLPKIPKPPRFLRLHEYHQSIGSPKSLQNLQHLDPLEQIGLGKNIIVSLIRVGEIEASVVQQHVETVEGVPFDCDVEGGEPFDCLLV